jgi:hypothetical protein
MTYFQPLNNAMIDPKNIYKAYKFAKKMSNSNDKDKSKKDELKMRKAEETALNLRPLALLGL